MRDLSFLKTYKISHRGLHDERVPENSLLAFEKAIKKGYAIECDIQASLEGEAFVFHDASLKRMTGLNQMIYHTPSKELERVTFKESSETIPSLKNVLDLVSGKVPLLIEIKSDSPVISLSKTVIDTLKDYKGLYAIHSFDPTVLRILKKEAPHILRGQISCFYEDQSMFFIKKWALKHMIYNRFTKPDFITYAIKNSPNKILDKLKSKTVMIGYTAKNKKAYIEALKYFDNTVFEGFIL